MTPIHALFFDLDDTLCDAKPAFAQGCEAAFDALLDRYTHLDRDTIRTQWRAIHAPLFAALAEGSLSMAAVRQRRFRDLLVALDVPDPEWADTLDRILGERQLSILRRFADTTILSELRERGLYLGIITNGAGDAHPDSQRSKAAHLGLIEQVDAFYVSDEIGYRKPDPRAFLPALTAAGVAPDAALYVGDSIENDIVGANAAGMVSVLLWRSSEPLPTFNPNAIPRYIISSLAELLALFPPS